VLVTTINSLFKADGEHDQELLPLKQAFELDASNMTRGGWTASDLGRIQARLDDGIGCDVVVTGARKERRLSRHSNNEALEPSFSFLFRRVLLAVPTLRSRRALGKQ
jgi:hypothetical protein